MATLTRGKTFGSTETVTNTKLHQLIDSGSVSSIVRGDFDAVTRPATAATTALSAPVNGELWYDTTSSILRAFDGANFEPTSKTTSKLLTNKTGTAVAVGDVVIVDTTTDDSFDDTATAGVTSVIGVVLEAIANDASGLVAIGGHVGSVKVAGATNRGDLLKTSTTVRQATSVSAADKGVFAIALSETVGAGTVSAFFIGMNHMDAIIVGGVFVPVTDSTLWVDQTVQTQEGSANALDVTTAGSGGKVPAGQIAVVIHIQHTADETDGTSDSATLIVEIDSSDQIHHRVITHPNSGNLLAFAVGKDAADTGGGSEGFMVGVDLTGNNHRQTMRLVGYIAG